MEKFQSTIRENFTLFQKRNIFKFRIHVHGWKKNCKKNLQFFFCTPKLQNKKFAINKISNKKFRKIHYCANIKYKRNIFVKRKIFAKKKFDKKNFHQKKIYRNKFSKIFKCIYARTSYDNHYNFISLELDGHLTLNFAK